MTTAPGADGVLLVDKPFGLTSHDVVAAVRRAMGTKRVGHAGTLDPFATGLLVLGTGRVTRLLEYLVGLDKVYHAVIRMGVETDTLDPDGTVTTTDERWRTISDRTIAAAATSLVGVQMQTPPVYSAIKVKGVPAHRRVRRGERVRLPARQVTVHALDILALSPPRVRIRVRCSSGTYVRSLARDIGAHLGTACHLAELRRTRVGHLTVAQAASLESVIGGSAGLSAWVDPRSALAHLPAVRLTAAQIDRFLVGQSVPVDAPDCSRVGFLGLEGTLVGVGSVAEGVARPRKVLAGAQGKAVAP